MLQQTQVMRVTERFTAFLERFPTVHDLAAADEQEVLALWSGLGYYRRARHLHAAARVIVLEHSGRVPCSPEDLMRLPGVGRYSAGSIASIVFRQRTPIVDGNVRRILARWFAHANPLDERNQWAWSQAHALVQAAESPGVFNEAMMELGATVCTPKNPKCASCPVAAFCAANRTGKPLDYPAPIERSAPTAAFHHSVIIMRNRSREVLVEQRGDRSMWANMWQTPTVESRRPLRRGEIQRAMTFTVSDLTRCGSFEHKTTHRRITFLVYCGTSRVRSGNWRSVEDIASLPMSNAQRRVLSFLKLKSASPAAHGARAARSSGRRRLDS
jgi:A/G-specific adenine glycosylase